MPLRIVSLILCAVAVPASAQVPKAIKDNEVPPELKKLIDDLKIEDLVTALQQHTRIDKTGQALARMRAQTLKEVEEAERQVGIHSKDDGVQKFINLIKSDAGKRQLLSISNTPEKELSGALKDLFTKEGISADVGGMANVLGRTVLLNRSRKAVAIGKEMIAKIDATTKAREHSAEATQTPFLEPAYFNTGNDPLARLQDIQANMSSLPKDRKPPPETMPQGADLGAMLREVIGSLN